MMTMLVLLFFSSISYISAFRNVKSVDFWRLSMPVIQPSCPRRLSLIDCDISTSHPASCPPHGSMRFRRSSMRLYAAKKKKRKKVLKADGAATSSSGNDASQSAARVSNQMNVSVRKQIQWAKALKRLNTNSQGGRVHKTKVCFPLCSTALNIQMVRKERAPKKEVEEYVEIDYENTPPPLVFVDGYNIIFYINSVEGRDIHLSDARDCLIADLGVLASATGWYIECVFDAYNNPGTPAGSRSDDNGCIVVYTSIKETADTYIERRFQELSQQHTRPNMVVATDDLVLRSSASSMGGDWLTADMLLQEFRIAYAGWELYQEEAEEIARMARPRLGDTLAKELRQSLKSMMIEEQQETVLQSPETDTGSKQLCTVVMNDGDVNDDQKKRRQKAVAVTAANMDDIIRAMQAEQRSKK